MNAEREENSVVDDQSDRLTPVYQTNRIRLALEGDVQFQETVELSLKATQKAVGKAWRCGQIAREVNHLWPTLLVTATRKVASREVKYNGIMEKDGDKHIAETRLGMLAGYPAVAISQTIDDMKSRTRDAEPAEKRELLLEETRQALRESGRISGWWRVRKFDRALTRYESLQERWITVNSREGVLVWIQKRIIQDRMQDAAERIDETITDAIGEERKEEIQDLMKPDPADLRERVVGVTKAGCMTAPVTAVFIVPAAVNYAVLRRRVAQTEAELADDHFLVEVRDLDQGTGWQFCHRDNLPSQGKTERVLKVKEIRRIANSVVRESLDPEGGDKELRIDPVQTWLDEKASEVREQLDRATPEDRDTVRDESFLAGMRGTPIPPGIIDPISGEQETVYLARCIVARAAYQYGMLCRLKAMHVTLDEVLDMRRPDRGTHTHVYEQPIPTWYTLSYVQLDDAIAQPLDDWWNDMQDGGRGQVERFIDLRERLERSGSSDTDQTHLLQEIYRRQVVDVQDSVAFYRSAVDERVDFLEECASINQIMQEAGETLAEETLQRMGRPVYYE